MQGLIHIGEWIGVAMVTVIAVGLLATGVLTWFLKHPD
jgi:hypothetical protein